MRRPLAWLFVLVWAALAQAQSQTVPQPKEGDFVLHDFHFRSGETLPNCGCTTLRWARRSAMCRAWCRTRLSFFTAPRDQERPI
jgi:hypothetical protein